MKKRQLLVMGLLLADAAVASGSEFKLTSSDMVEGGKLKETHVYSGFGCQGGNLSPALAWDGVPVGTKGFAVTVYDPDAPTGSGWWHWVVFDIPANVTRLPTGAGTPTSGLLPKTVVQSRTDFGVAGFGGPCPPAGDKPHRYVITVHALKTERLGLTSDAMPALVGFMLNQNTLAKATMTVKYGR